MGLGRNLDDRAAQIAATEVVSDPDRDRVLFVTPGQAPEAVDCNMLRMVDQLTTAVESTGVVVSDPSGVGNVLRHAAGQCKPKAPGM